MIQINLLPWREQARKKQQSQFGMVVASVVLAGVVVTGIFHLHYASEINYQNKRNAVLQQELDAESVELLSLDKQKQDLLDIDNQLHFIFALRDTSYHAVRLLNELTIRNPEAVTLYKIIRTGNNVLIFGKAKSNMQVTLFMDSIEKSKFFNQPVLTEISGKENDAGEQRNFQLRLVQQE